MGASVTDPMKNKWCFSGFGKESGQILDRLLRNCIGGADAVLVLLNVAELGYYLGVDYHGGRSRERRYSNNIQKSIAEDIHKALTENYHMHWKAAMFAEKYGLSDTTVKSYFRNIYGYSFKAYQMKVRMEKAAELLLTTEAKIVEIALDIGYVSPARFISAFKKYYRMTPSEYRRINKLFEPI